MIAKLFSAVVYLPIIVICMIISQIYLERYWVTGNRHHFTGSVFIIITYFLQELCLLQLSLENLNLVSFVQVISMTLFFRGTLSRLWSGLLVITPFYINVIGYFQGISSLSNWPYWLLESITFIGICSFLSNWQHLHERMRYILAMVSLGILELGSLKLTHTFSLVNAAGPTLGLLLITAFEDQQYSIELKQQKQLQILRRESRRDDLTGLLNYRSLLNKLESLTNNDQVIVGAIDIDHFKHINDTYGHLVGNEVLSFFSTTLRTRIHSNFPDNGFVYRFGGEEFAIVVTNYSLKEVDEVLQEIEQVFITTPIKISNYQKTSLTFSCGLTVHQSDEAFEQTLNRADEMLYNVKRNGRGWVATYDRYNNDKSKK